MVAVSDRPFLGNDGSGSVPRDFAYTTVPSDAHLAVGMWILNMECGR
jgi:hypothetical protein